MVVKRVVDGTQRIAAVLAQISNADAAVTLYHQWHESLCQLRRAKRLFVSGADLLERGNVLLKAVTRSEAGKQLCRDGGDVL